MSQTNLPVSRQVHLLTAARTVLETLNLPHSAPGRAARTDPTDIWASGLPGPEIDRTTLAWATAYRMLADHQPDTTPLTHVAGADAVLRELGVRGLAILQSGLPIRPRLTIGTRCVRTAAVLERTLARSPTRCSAALSVTPSCVIPNGTDRSRSESSTTYSRHSLQPARLSVHGCAAGRPRPVDRTKNLG